MVRIKQSDARKLLNLEVYLSIIVVFILFGCIFLSEFSNMNNNLKIILIFLGFILFIIGILICLRIEQIAGYYKCCKCGHKYIPLFLSILIAMHIGRTRYMKCPSCGKRSWNKKVIE